MFTFRRIVLLCCLGFWASPLCAAPHVVIEGKIVPCTPPPVLIGGEVHVPLAFRYGSLPISVDTDGEEVIVRAPGGMEARVPFVLHDGHVYYPLATACREVQLGARWIERLQKLFVAPLISSVRPEVTGRVLTLRLAASYPVSASVEVLQSPPRLVVQVANAQLFTESTVLPVGQARVTQVRAAQHSYDPSVVRAVVDLEGTPRYRALSLQDTTQVRIRIGVVEGASAAAVEAQLEVPDPEGGTVDVVGVYVEAGGEGDARVVVRTTGRARAAVERLDSPPRLALDVQNAVLRTPAPEVAPGTPLVRRVRLGQFTASVARVVVDLAEEAVCVLEEGPEPGTLVLSIQAALGLTRVHGLRGLRIVVDPGHGGSLHGTTGLSGRREQDINLDVARRLYRLLEECGAQPILTREGDQTVGLYARPAMANARRAHAFVSIHCNSNGRANSARGIETFYCWPHSLPLARAVHYALVKELPAPDRRVRRRPGLAVTRKARMPAILVEIGYMNHREEDELLGTAEYRQRVARAIFSGISRWAGEKAAPLESGEPAADPSGDPEPVEGADPGAATEE